MAFNTSRDRQGFSRATTQQLDQYLLFLCKEEQEEHCQSPTNWPPVGHFCEYFCPNYLKQMVTLQHQAAQLAFNREHQNQQNYPLVPLTNMSRFSLSMWQARKSLEMQCQTLCSLHYHSALSICKWVSDSLRRHIFLEGHTDLQVLASV